MLLLGCCCRCRGLGRATALLLGWLAFLLVAFAFAVLVLVVWSVVLCRSRLRGGRGRGGRLGVLAGTPPAALGRGAGLGAFRLGLKIA